MTRPWRLTLTLLATGAFLTVARPVAAAERVVMFEEFTATWCGYCVYAGQAMSQLMDEHPDEITSIQIHLSDNYQISWGYNRATGYGVEGIPDIWIDGKIDRVGAVSKAQAYAQYLADFQQRSAIGTAFTVELGGEHLSGQTYRITMRVTVDPGVTEPKDIKLQIAQVLDYWPAGTQYRDCVMQATNSLGNYTVTGGDVITETWDITLQDTTIDPSLSNLDDVSIIGWVREYGALPRTVYNAWRMRWPFEALPPENIPGDVNGDCTVDLTDLGLLLGHYGSTEASWGDGDLSGDGTVDLTDLGELLGAYGSTCP